MKLFIKRQRKASSQSMIKNNQAQASREKQIERLKRLLIKKPT